MLAAPALSIIIPASGQAPLLARALVSIGPFVDCEILVVTDRQLEWSSEDPRVVVLRANGHGANAARNLGLAVARAPLVAFLNPKDRWHSTKLECQLMLHAARSSIGMSFTDHVLMDQEGRDYGTALEMASGFATRHAGRSLPFALGEDALAQLFADDVVGTSTVMVQTALLRDSGGFEPGLASAAPWDSWLRLSTMAPIACIPWSLAEQTLPSSVRMRDQAPLRLAAMRQVVHRYRDAVLCQDAAAVRHCAARLLVSEAENNRAGWTQPSIH